MNLIQVGSSAPNFIAKDQHGQNISLSDYNGIFNEQQGISDRANIIIDENGIVKWAKVYYAKQLPDINEVLEVLSNM